MTFAPSLKSFWLSRRLRNGANAATSHPFLVLGIGIGATVLIASAVAAHFILSDRLMAVHERHLKLRAYIQNERMASQTGPYIALAGDSHADLLGWDRLCDLPIVNLGMGGANAGGYRTFADRLVMQPKPAAILLFIGTNDLAHVRKPKNAKSFTSFRFQFEALTALLAQRTDHLFHVPLLPEHDPSKPYGHIDPDVARDYHKAVAEICGKTGCRLIPLFGMKASFRDDGVHLDLPDRRIGGSLHRHIEKTVCPAIGPTGGRRHSVKSQSPQEARS